jgi:hypothetical protein
MGEKGCLYCTILLLKFYCTTVYNPEMDHLYFTIPVDVRSEIESGLPLSHKSVRRYGHLRGVDHVCTAMRTGMPVCVSNCSSPSFPHLRWSYGVCRFGRCPPPFVQSNMACRCMLRKVRRSRWVLYPRDGRLSNMLPRLSLSSLLCHRKHNTPLAWGVCSNFGPRLPRRSYHGRRKDTAYRNQP